MSMDILERSIFDVPLVVIDTETTGLIPGIGHRIVELGLVRLEPNTPYHWKVSNEFSQLLNPGRSMDPDASRVNGITNKDLVGRPTFDDIAAQILEMMDGAVLAAHNAQFDASFLAMELYIRRLYDPEAKDEALPNPWLCTLMLARRNFYFGRNSLGHVARQLGVRHGRAHRALGDVYTTLEVLKRMVQKLGRQGIEAVGDLLHVQGGSIYTPHLPYVTLPPPLDQALMNGESLRIVYDGPLGRSERNVNPQYASEYNGKKYLITYCDESRDQRTFRVDRILKAEVI